MNFSLSSNLHWKVISLKRPSLNRNILPVLKTIVNNNEEKLAYVTICSNFSLFHSLVSKIIKMFLHQESNQQISWCQTSILELGRGWRECYLWRATRIRKLLRNAVTERRMWTTEKWIDSCWSPPYKEGEQSSSRIVFACVPPQVKFVVDIILYLFRFPCSYFFFQ